MSEKEKQTKNDVFLLGILSLLSLILGINGINKLSEMMQLTLSNTSVNAIRLIYITGSLEISMALFLLVPKLRFPASILTLLTMLISGIFYVKLGASSEILFNFAIALIAAYIAYRYKGCCFLLNRK